MWCGLLCVLLQAGCDSDSGTACQPVFLFANDVLRNEQGDVVTVEAISQSSAPGAELRFRLGSKTDPATFIEKVIRPLCSTLGHDKFELANEKGDLIVSLRMAHVDESNMTVFFPAPDKPGWWIPLENTVFIDILSDYTVRLVLNVECAQTKDLIGVVTVNPDVSVHDFLRALALIRSLGVHRIEFVGLPEEGALPGE